MGIRPDNASTRRQWMNQRKGCEWTAGEFMTRGSRIQRNSVSWSNERAAMLDRIVIDRGLGGEERKPTRCHLARGTAGRSKRNIDPIARGIGGWSELSATCEIGSQRDRSYVNPAETAGRPLLHKSNAKFYRSSRICARAHVRVFASLAWPRSTRGARHQRHALHNGHVFSFSYLLHAHGMRRGSPPRSHTARNNRHVRTTWLLSHVPCMHAQVSTAWTDRSFLFERVPSLPWHWKSAWSGRYFPTRSWDPERARQVDVEEGNIYIYWNFHTYPCNAYPRQFAWRCAVPAAITLRAQWARQWS